MRIHLASFAKLLVALAFALALLTIVASPSARAEEEQSAQGSNEVMATWIPYDYVNYKTNTSCNNRLKYLRSVYPDMNLSNTKCTAKTLPQCPPKTVYWIYIIDRGTARTSLDAAEGLQSTISPSDLALAC